MRIRKSASRLLGSSFTSAPPAPAPRFELELPPLPPPAPPQLYPGPGESSAGAAGLAAETASVEPCELSRSPWDLIGELDLSDPQEEDLVGKYFVSVACRASWLFPTSMSAATLKREEALAVAAAHAGSDWQRHKPAKKPVAKKTVVNKQKQVEKSTEPMKKAKIKTEESNGQAAADGGEPQVWMCKKNDGRRWQCSRQVSHPNGLCHYHFEQKRSYYCPVSDSNQGQDLSAAVAVAAPVATSSAASKPPTSSKPKSSKSRRKKLGDAGEGFYYYAGFGPFRSKRHCRSSDTSMQESSPVRQEDEEEEEAPPEHHTAPAAGQAQAQAQADDNNGSDHQQLTALRNGDDPSCDDFAGIAGGDEESSDDNGDYHLRVGSGHGNGESWADVNSDSKKKPQWKKRWRKPVKARSLKSLM